MHYWETHNLVASPIPGRVGPQKIVVNKELLNEPSRNEFPPFLASEHVTQDI